MKPLDTDRVGGRIRKVRTDAKKTIREFSEQLHVTGNYLGLVERGERNPSVELLQRISTSVNVPLDWLINGEPTRSEKKAGQKHSNKSNTTAKVVNPQLFLSLVLMRAPNITQDTLATVLITSSDTVDKVLAGEPVIFDPRWYKAFSVLAQNLDLATLRRELRELDEFLEQEEATAKNMAFLQALQSSFEQSYSIEFPSYEFFSDFPVQIILRAKDYPESKWICLYCPAQEFKDKCSIHEVFGDLIDLSESSCCKVSIILDSLDAYNQFSNYLDGYETELDAMDFCYPKPNVSLFYYDEKEKSIGDEREFFDG